MKSRLREPPNDPLRKGTFREQARILVRDDRYKRKYGNVVDTAGMIARALERAYRAGFEDAQREDPTWNRTVAQNEEAVEWLTIPSRARKAFESFAYSVLGRDGHSRRESYYVPAVTERGTAGWSLSGSNRPRYASPLEEAKAALSDKTMAILLRLGLVMYADAERQRIVISERGCNTWAKNCERAFA